MKEIHLITVGKLTDKNFQEIEKDYLKRVNLFKLTIHEIKSRSENIDFEAIDVMNKVAEIAKGKKPNLVLLKEAGKCFNSINFADYLSKLIADSKVTIFIFGGAAGHGEAVLKNDHTSLSLSELTFPHQMARVVFIEQMYRAQTILTKHPYHK